MNPRASPRAPGVAFAAAFVAFLARAESAPWLGTRDRPSGRDVAGEVPIDRVIAVLDAAQGEGAGSGVQVVTDRALDAEVAFLLAARGDPLPQPPLPSELRAAVLDQVVDETLLAAEASRLDLVDVAEDDLAQAHAAIGTRLGAPRLASVLARAGLEAGDARAILLRRITASRFIDHIIRPTIAITEERIRDTYAATGSARSLDEERPILRAALVERDLRERVARLVASLRQRARVRIQL